MTFLRVNGVEVSVADATSGLSVRTIGVDKTTQINRRKMSRSGVVLSHQNTTTLLPQTDATFLAALFAGRHHRMSFDSNLWSTRGRPPRASNTATIVAASPTPKHGAGRLALASSSSFVSWLFDDDKSAARIGQSWFAQAWRCATTNPADWQLWQVCSDGRVFVGGARDDAQDRSWFTVADDVATLRQGSSACAAVDDLFVVFARPTDVMATQMASWAIAGNPQPDSPLVTCDGDFDGGRSSSFMPALVDGGGTLSKYFCERNDWIADTMINNAMQVAFSLTQERGSL